VKTLPRLLMTIALAMVLSTATVPTATAAGEGLVVGSVQPAQALERMWEHYGDTGGGWTGADSTYSVPLPDGRDAWIFSDTFLGRVNPDGSRPLDSPFIHNSIVLQDEHRLTTVTGGSPAHPQSLIGPTPTGPPTDPSTQNSSWYWIGDGVVDAGSLRVFALKFVSTGTAQFDFRFDSDAIATFSLPDLRLVSLTPTYSGGNVTWGSWVQPAGDWTYVYGVEDYGFVKYMHVARAARGSLLGPWQFWTGTTWSADPTASARLMSGVANEYSVTRLGDRWVLVTFDTNVLFGNEIVAYSASSPTGPFTDRVHLYSAPEATVLSGGNLITYNAHAHPELGHDDRLTISYNVNSLDVHDVYRDVHDYRARFIDVRFAE
jgi:hypothetical protein